MRMLVAVFICLWCAPAAMAQDAAPTTPAAKPAAKQKGKAPAVKPAAKPGRTAPGKEAEPATDATADQAKNAQPDDKKPAEEEKEKPPPRDKRFVIDLGWASRVPTGDRHKLLEYATPPTGVFLRELKYSALVQRDGLASEIALKGLGQDDYRADALLDLCHGATYLQGFLARNLFYDPTPTVVGSSNRKIGELYAKQDLTRDFGLSFRYRMDEQNVTREAPNEPLYQRTRYWDLVADGKVGQGQIGVIFSDLRFFDRTLVLPNTATQRFALRGLWAPSSTMDFETVLSRHTMTQTGGPTNYLDSVSFNGGLDLGPSTDLMLRLRDDHYKLPTAQGAYDREQRFAGTTLIHRYMGWAGKLDLQYREADRVRGDQQYLDVPRWWTLGGRVAGKIGPRIRLAVRGSTQHASQLPTQVTDDPRNLMWGSRDFLQTKFDGGTPIASWYTTWTYRHQTNSARSASVTSNFYTAGGNWQIGKSVNLFGEFDYEAWSGTSDVTEYPTLSNFIPSSRTSILGASWNLNDRTSVMASYTEFVTDNDNPLLLPDGNTHGQFVTINIRHRLRSGRELALMVAPWMYHDKVLDKMNYSTTIVQISGSAAF